MGCKERHVRKRLKADGTKSGKGQASANLGTGSDFCGLGIPGSSLRSSLCSQPCTIPGSIAPSKDIGGYDKRCTWPGPEALARGAGASGSSRALEVAHAQVQRVI